MPKEPNGAGPHHAPHKIAEQRPAPKTRPKSEEGNAVGQDPTTDPYIPSTLVAPPANPPGRLKRVLRWLASPEGTGVMMVVLTAVIAGSGIVGIILVIQGGRDTTRIREAAERQARAAQQFADTAILINTNIDSAVGKLNQQAQATEDTASAAVGANRAWVVPAAFSDSVEPINITFQNAGKTPAVEVSATAEYDLAAATALENGCDRLKSTKWKSNASIVLGGSPFSITLQSVPPEWKAPIADLSTRWLLIHGCVWYTDVLTNRQRTTEFWLDAIRFRNDKLAASIQAQGQSFRGVLVQPSLQRPIPFVFR
jgi:hypothetical protein